MVATEQFLIDKSAHVRVWKPGIEELWKEALSRGQVAVCEPTEFEILYSARSVEEYEKVKTGLRGLYGWEPVPDGAWRDVLALQRDMTRSGSHRAASAVDLLVAVTAQSRGLTVLHYDRDFETIAQHTTVKTRWLAEPGSID